MESIVVENIDAYCRSKGWTIKEIERLSGLANGAVGRWRKGKQGPTVKSLEKLEELTGIPVSLWLTKGAISGKGKKQHPVADA